MKVELKFLQEVADLDILEKNFYYQLGFRIRFYRQTKHLSQTYMAAKLNISQTAYSKIEAGKSSCSVYRLIHILEVLNLDPKHLLIIKKKPVFGNRHE